MDKFTSSAKRIICIIIAVALVLSYCNVACFAVQKNEVYATAEDFVQNDENPEITMPEPESEEENDGQEQGESAYEKQQDEQSDTSIPNEDTASDNTENNIVSETEETVNDNPVPETEDTETPKESDAEIDIVAEQANSEENAIAEDADEPQMFKAESEDVAVEVSADKDAFREDVILVAEKSDDEKAEELINGIDFGEENYIYGQFITDIHFENRNGEEVEPAVPVKVTITPKQASSVLGEIEENARIIHITNRPEPEIIETSYVKHEPAAKKNRLMTAKRSTEDTRVPGSFTFEADTFSDYALVYIDAYTDGVINSDTQEPSVGISYGKDAKIPRGACVTVNRITDSDERYEQLLNDAADAVDGVISAIRFYDIEITDNGKEIEPASSVDVSMKFENTDFAAGGNVKVVHFSENILIPEVFDAECGSDRTENTSSVAFSTTGFSVYAIADVERPESYLNETVQRIDELNEDGFYLSVKRPDSMNTFYFMNTMVENDKIKKTAANKIEDAKPWYFEKVEGTENQFYMYCYSNTGEKLYIKMLMTSGQEGKVKLLANEKTPFHIEYYDEGVEGSFYIGNGLGYGFNMRSGDNGKGFNGNSNRRDVGSRISIRRTSSMPNDPYSLDGKTYGLLLVQNETTGAALEATAKNATTLEARQMLIRPDPTGITGEVNVLSGDDMAEWTFHSISKDKYYLTTEVNGITKYLTINNTGLTLENVPADNSVLTVTPESGENANRVRISNQSGYAINLINGKITSGYGVSRSGSVNEWLNLARKTHLQDEDFVNYEAKKVSVSDTTRVTNGSKVLIYTRIWNDAEKRYDFYLVNHNGTLLPCYDSGDEIRWTGSRINTVTWTFTEYYYEGTNNPNYYYELQSDYSEKYVAPQIEQGQILSDSPIGINLNGRRYGDYYTSILAWDDANYDYAAWNINNDKRLVSMPMSKATDFYFAILKDGDEELTTTDTIDNDDYGITMKMVDFNQDGYFDGQYRDRTQTNLLGATTNEPGMVYSYLEENGYPLTNPLKTKKAQGSLQTLFGSAEEVNHLFLSETYQESGYFEFNSLQNFAHLGDDNNFVVYDQLGTIDVNTKSIWHGQFMPYNEIHPGVISQSYYNKNDVYNNELSELNPRKYEKLYDIPFRNVPAGTPNRADYFFGMEMEADFMQSENGKDNWNHDLIFEFAGDDDMWLYIDGQLVLDLGGIHSAMVGTINFRTGDVLTRGTRTTLREVFKANYQSRHPEATESEVNAYLSEIFTLNDEGNYVFKNYSAHTMKMFYMERGAGASNLHMRFNLTSVEDGQVILNKEIAGTDKQDYLSTKFPYQIWYKEEHSETFQRVNGTNCTVLHAGTNNPIEYRETYNGYPDVFLIRPGESAEIQLPNDDVEYYIVECGVQTNIYDKVYANHEELTGTEASATTKDYPIGITQVKDRKKVIYQNKANESSLRTLTITKRLFDINGTELTRDDDPTGFRFRAFMGNELDYYRFDTYCVKAPDGTYCIYDKNVQGFVSTGISDYSALSDSQKEKTQFRTSMSGAIDKIPAGYSVEIRNLVVGTQFRVEERENDFPKGYKLIGYHRVDGSYIIDPGNDSVNSGTIRDNSNPKIEVHNRRGWGLTVNKVWSDSDYMVTHDDIYFGVYVDDVLMPGTLRKMRTSKSNDHPLPETSLYYYFDDLEPGKTFADYQIKEVVPENPTVDADNYVTSYDSLTVIENREYMTIGGQRKGDVYRANAFRYGALYKTGETVGGNDNVRSDTVENVRDGIRIIKTDWAGNPLTGGVFTLKTGDGTSIGADTYSAKENGQITIAYLDANVSYYLEEQDPPLSHIKTEESVEITVDENGIVSATGTDPDDIVVRQRTADKMPEIQLKNKTFNFTVKKIDESTQEPMAGVHFAIYKQRQSTAGLMKDYYPLNGYDDLVTDSEGELPERLRNIRPGTYYLEEVSTLDGYTLLESDIEFTISETGGITINTPQYRNMLSTNQEEEGVFEYLLTIPNTNTVDICLEKEISGNMANKEDKFDFSLFDFRKKGGTVLTGSYTYGIYDTLHDNLELETGIVNITLDGEISKAQFKKRDAATQSETVKLGHGDKLIIRKIPKGTSFSAEEAEPENELYKTTCIVTNAETNQVYFDGEEAAAESPVTCEYLDTDNRSIKIQNIRSGGVLLKYVNAFNAAIPTTADNRSITVFAVIAYISCVCAIILCLKKKRD